MRFFVATACAACMIIVSAASHADVMVVYDSDAGGNNIDGIQGLGATALFSVSGTQLTILLSNTSTDAPDSFTVADTLLVSIGFNLGNVSFVSGDSALIGSGSVGLGTWSGLGEGDSVAEEWLWTNDFGGDLMEAFSQVISTSNGQGGGTSTDFNGNIDPNVSGPFGGIAGNPPVLDIPGNQRAVSNSIMFTMTLSDFISEMQLVQIANSSIVEFGSDHQYLSVPSPGALALLATAGLITRRRRRH